MTKKLALNRKKIAIILIVSFITVLFLYIFGYLCSIRFKVEYLLYPSIGTADFKDFKKYKKDLERLVEYTDVIVNNEKNSVEKYGSRCMVTKERLCFFKDRNRIDFPISMEEWETAYKYIFKFPSEDGPPQIEYRSSFPDYVFFEYMPKTSRIFVYTRGEYPKKLIDSLWEEHDFVEVIRLARGWYDIRPIG